MTTSATTNSSDGPSPGEWTLERDGSLVISGQVIGLDGLAPDGAGPAEKRANARLMSAAPNLLAAANAAYDAIADEAQAYTDHDMAEKAAPWLEVMKVLAAAIKKAERR